MLPEFFDGRNLPEGLHEANWVEFEERFGAGTEKRIQLCSRLRTMLESARHCGFRRVVVFGSFVSSKAEPGDFDLLWLMVPNFDRTQLSAPCRELLESNRSRERFGCDVMDAEDDSPFLKMFTSSALGMGYDKDTKTARGLVVLNLEEV